MPDNEDDSTSPVVTDRTSSSHSNDAHDPNIVKEVEHGHIKGVDENEKDLDLSTALSKIESKPEDYPHGLKLGLVLLSIYLAIFLVALDRTIIATALPRITDEFKSFQDIGWYNAAFTLPLTALQLFFGRLYTFYSPKWIYLSLVVVFEIGSAVCGAAPNSIAFIMGRAVAGIGAGGLFNGSMILMMYAAPLEKRAMYLGLIGAVFGVSSVAGPLLGGVFTTSVTWRWCFYINLPIGGLTILFLYFAVQNTEPALGNLTVPEKLRRLDLPGTAVFIPCIVCLLLALQWGGSTYAWSDWRIILLFVLFGVLLLIFIAIQFWRKEAATVPPRIAKQRTIASAALFAFCLSSSFLIIVYYVSIWFQAIKGDTAIHSGISTIPFIMAMVIASIFSGVAVSKIGWYNPFILGSIVLSSIGAGLFTLFKPDTNHSMWIGVQVLYGFGIGMGLQQPNIAAQAVLDKKDAPTGISLVYFGQGLGATLCVAIGQSLLDNKLVSGLTKLGNISPQQVVDTGATELRDVFSADQIVQVVKVYNQAIVYVFYVAMAFAVASLVPGLFIEWKSVKNKKKTTPKEDPEKNGVEVKPEEKEAKKRFWQRKRT